MSDAAPKKRETSVIGAAAEYYVMFQLLRQGFVAALAPKGVPEVDILVTDLGCNSLAEIQVKGRQFSNDSGWTMNVKHEGIVRESLFYCFVDFGGLADQPRCWLLHSRVVADVLKQSHAAWLATPGRNGREHQDWNMRRITHSYAYASFYRPNGWLNEYLEAWTQLKEPRQ